MIILKKIYIQAYSILSIINTLLLVGLGTAMLLDSFLYDSWSRLPLLNIGFSVLFFGMAFLFIFLRKHIIYLIEILENTEHQRVISRLCMGMGILYFFALLLLLPAFIAIVFRTMVDDVRIFG